MPQWMWTVVEWFRRLGKPKGWCDRCRCVHECNWDFARWKKFEDELIQKMADQIRYEIDRELIAELLNTPSEPGGQTPVKKDET